MLINNNNVKYFLLVKEELCTYNVRRNIYFVFWLLRIQYVRIKPVSDSCGVLDYQYIKQK